MGSRTSAARADNGQRSRSVSRFSCRDLLGLLDPHRDTRLAAVERLAESGGPAAVFGLLMAVIDPDGDVRLKAIEGLGGCGGRTACLALLAILRSEDPDARAQAAEALSNYPCRRTEKALVEALHDEYAWVRLCAVEALGYVGSARSLPEVVSLLDDRSPIVRMWAGASLRVTLVPQRLRGMVRRALQKRLSRERLGAARAAMYAALYVLGDRHALRRLLSLLRSRSAHTRGVAATNLGYLAEEGQLLSEDAPMAIAAVEAALSVESDRYVEPLTEARSELRKLTGDPG